MCNSVQFSGIYYIYNGVQHYQGPEHFHHLQWKPCTHKAVTLYVHLTTTNLLSLSLDVSFLDIS